MSQDKLMDTATKSMNSDIDFLFSDFKNKSIRKETDFHTPQRKDQDTAIAEFNPMHDEFTPNTK